MVFADAQRIQFSQSRITVGLIETRIVFRTDQGSFWSVKEQTDFERMCILLVRKPCSYLGDCIDNGTGARSSCQTCTNVEGDVFIATGLLDPLYGTTDYLFEIARIVFVEDVICHQRSSQSTALSTYACTDQGSHFLLHQLQVGRVEESLQPRI